MNKGKNDGIGTGRAGLVGPAALTWPSWWGQPQAYPGDSWKVAAQPTTGNTAA